MNPERWLQIETLYNQALELDAGERTAFLGKACVGDDNLRREVEELLSEGPLAEGFLKETALREIALEFHAAAPRPWVGRRVGNYEFVSLLGAGGMGEVYRARDTKLKREVAIKVIPDEFSGDPERISRLQREAELLASLNHPNIAAIHDIEELNASHFLILELVEGETLADRIRRGPLLVEEALRIALRIAEALEAAHEKNIIHRDLKPANIKVSGDGVVKVLDFGLAKEIEKHGDLPSSQALSTPGEGDTRDGVILGTAAYMSPEQARGQRVSAQTDVWAFGAVLYEMLTGRSAFRRETLTDTIAAVIEREPDWTALPESTPGIIVRLLRRTLEKNPDRRLHAIADARLDLEEARDVAREATLPSAAARSSRSPARTLALGVAAGVFLLVVAAWVASGAWGLRLVSTGTPVPTQKATRLSIAAIGEVSPQMAPVVSPDGRRLAYVSTGSPGGSRIWVRDLDALAPRVLAGTEDAAHLFWAPDGSAIGFVASGKLKRVDTGNGQVLTLADGALRSGATWSSAGVILFVTSRASTREFVTIPATGGPVSTVLILKNQSAGWPAFLPDGRHFIFHAAAADGAGGVYVGSLGSQETKLVLPGDFGAVFAAPDYLVFGRPEGFVFAQHFDLMRLEVIGEPFPVAEGVWSYLPGARVSVSATGGVLAYVNASLANTQPAWFDRSGRPLGTVSEPGPYGGQSPRISSDGANLALTHDGSAGGGVPPGSGGVWVTRLADGTTRRLTLEPGARTPVWSNDASRILFSWGRGAESAVSIQDVRASDPARLVGPMRGLVMDWSPDGQRIIFGKGSPMDLWILPVAGGDAIPFARSPFNKTQAQISPDGRWIVYTSLDTGHDEVYVDSFPVASNRRQVSVGGGMQPRWRRDGSELFYLTPDQLMMAVPVTSKSGYFDAGRATPLFRTRILTIGSQITPLGAYYDVTPDGQRFLINGWPADPGPPMTVVLNWAAGLK